MTSQSGLSAELIVIAAVIIGGASILGGRGRVVGACLGAVLTVLIDKVLREGWPIDPHHQDRRCRGDGERRRAAAGRRGAGLPRPPAPRRRADRAVHHPPPGARHACGRGSRGRPPPPAPEIGGVAIEGVQTKGTMASDRALTARGLGRFLARRDALAIILAVVLWLVGLLSAARLLVEPRQQLRHPPQLHRAWPALRSA